MNYRRRRDDPVVIHDSPSYQLMATMDVTHYGISLKLISFMPGAVRPEHHVQFQALLSVDELTIFKNAIEKVLSRAVASATI
jgi:hypothetical protein